MIRNPRCLYNNHFSAFLRDTESSVLGTLYDNYHGESRTTTTDAWKTEISIMRDVVSHFASDGQIILNMIFPASVKE